GCTDTAKQAAYAFNGDFVLISDTQAHADQAVTDAKAAPLTDDAAYQDWTGKVGDRGVANFYVAKEAAGYIADSLGSFGGWQTSSGSSGASSAFPSAATSGFPTDIPTDLTSGFPSAFVSSTSIPSVSVAGDPGASAPYARAAQDDPNGASRKALARFKGAAGALRFADGGAELEIVGGGLDPNLASGPGAGDLVTGLPGDTTAVFGFAVPKGWAAKVTDNLDSLGLPMFGSGSDFRSTLHNRLGITLPDDLQTLLGTDVALSLSGTPVADIGSVKSPKDLPFGVTVKGDPTKIRAVIAKIEAKQGKTLAASGVSVRGGNGKVTLSYDAGYAKSLQSKGDLGGNDSFKKVVPQAAKASVVFYVDFNSKWRAGIANSMSSDPSSAKDFLVNTDPLEAFGMSSWSDAGTSHVLVKLTTD
ncbi:MAG: hypothetical protein ABI873_12885, partial [Marmoricola sp.]